ncbi:MAG: hypothetical protein ACYTEQ_03770 [Planctomycetota bacterium]|jgi:hypothetical protein
MESRIKLTGKDVIVIVVCFTLMLGGLGAVGSAGKRRAKDVVCLSNLKKWAVVWKEYVDDNGGYFMEEWNWMYSVRPYFENRRLLLCPEAARPRIPPEGEYYQVGGTFHAWVYPDDPGDMVCVGSYGVNQWVSRAYDGWREMEKLWRTPYVTGAANVPLFLDCCRPGLTPLAYDEPPDYDGQVYEAGMNINEMRGFCLNRHSAAINGLFLDFSVRRTGLKGLWYLWWHRDWPIPSSLSPPTVWDEPEHWMYNFKDY